MYRSKITGFVAMALLFCLLSIGSLVAQRNSVRSERSDTIWRAMSESSIESRGRRSLVPERYAVFRLDAKLLESTLSAAPVENSAMPGKSMITLAVPTPKGEIIHFSIEESSVLSPEIAAQFPKWKYYQGYGVEDPTMVARFDWTDSGFHGYVMTSEGTFSIDPYQVNDRQNYIVYYKKDFDSSQSRFHCRFDELASEKEITANDLKIEKPFESFTPNDAPEFVHGASLRTYRLAIATTGEYTAFFRQVGDTDLQAQTRAFNAVTTSVNRINQVYRKELSLFLTLVSGTNLTYVSTTETPSNYANDGSGGDLTANVSNINSIIGSANYDFGHLFETGDGGIASLQSVCGSQKASGLSGLPNPTGDPFDVDYVAHEMGHQLGGNHTFSAAANCGNSPTNRRMEPGSAVTIMGYAGICGSTANVARNSIDIFHVVNLTEITTFLAAAGAGCGTTSTPNNVPVVPVLTNYTIPFNTPFTLTASATDADSDALTFNWEQNNQAASGANYPGTTDDDDIGLVFRPGFRSYLPTVSPSRTFPSLYYILNNQNEAPITFNGTSPIGVICAGTCISGEDLPSAARTMNFRVSVRDGKGGIADQGMTLAIINTTTPFSVTAPNTAVTWPGGSSQTVTWNVSGTTANGINTADVRILLSTDGGLTFPTVLTASTPNDGTEQLTIPSIGSTTARIKVEAVGNVFFDISNTNFTITAVNYSVSGRVFGQAGRGVRHARVTLTPSSGSPIVVFTNTFGQYNVADVPGGTYTITAAGRRFTYLPQIMAIGSNLSNVDFTPIP